MGFEAAQVSTFISQQAIASRVAELGAQLTKDYQGKALTLVGIMKGSVFFLTDLARAIDLPLTVEMLGVSSYQGGTETTGEVRITSDLTKPMADKHIVIVEDIIDSGRTMLKLLALLKERNPASVAVCSLLDKKLLPTPIPELRWVGFTAPPAFLVGYGLDHAEDFRHLPFIGDLTDG